MVLLPHPLAIIGYVLSTPYRPNGDIDNIESDRTVIDYASGYLSQASSSGTGPWEQSSPDSV